MYIASCPYMGSPSLQTENGDISLGGDRKSERLRDMVTVSGSRILLIQKNSVHKWSQVCMMYEFYEMISHPTLVALNELMHADMCTASITIPTDEAPSSILVLTEADWGTEPHCEGMLSQFSFHMSKSSVSGSLKKACVQLITFWNKMSRPIPVGFKYFTHAMIHFYNVCMGCPIWPSATGTNSSR